jgi:homoserine dehydrogenase
MAIAIIGFGGVGSAFYHLFNEKQSSLPTVASPLSISYILSRTGGYHFTSPEFDLSTQAIRSSLSPTMSWETILADPRVRVIVELTPTNVETGEPGLSYIKEALTAGKHVITGNKGPLLHAMNELKTLADLHRVRLLYGCTAGGALPSLDTARYSLSGTSILGFEGILNGTTNYILHLMTLNQMSYEDALKQAQLEGIAETNPHLDVSGYDTATKIAIIANTLFMTKLTLSDIEIQGIEHIKTSDILSARLSHQKIKLIGRFSTKSSDKLEASVKPVVLDETHPLYHVDAKNKAITYYTDTMGHLTISGGASGLKSAAAAIFRDLVNLVKSGGLNDD